MNIFHIILSKVSATISVILVTIGLQASPQMVELPVDDPVQVVVATTTKPEVTTITIDLLKPSVRVTATVATTTTSTSTATTTPVVEATTSPVVVPVITLPTQQVTPVTQLQTVYIQVQPEAPVASAIPKQMGKTYTLYKGDSETGSKVLSSVSEQEIRDFTEGLNAQINWKKQVRTADIDKLADALQSNGYTLSED